MRSLWGGSFFFVEGILDPKQNYIKMPDSCDFTNATSIGVVVHDNKVYSESPGAVVEGCGKTISAADWIKIGVDPGTTLHSGISSADIMQLGADLLGF